MISNGLGHGSLANILGAINVADGLGQLTLIVDDGRDGTNHGNVLVTASSVTGLSQGAINYTAGSNGHGSPPWTSTAARGRIPTWFRACPAVRR